MSYDYDFYKIDPPDGVGWHAERDFTKWYVRQTWGVQTTKPAPLQALLMPEPLSLDPYQIPAKEGEAKEEAQDRRAMNLYLAGGSFLVPDKAAADKLELSAGGLKLRIIVNPLLEPGTVYVLDPKRLCEAEEEAVAQQEEDRRDRAADEAYDDKKCGAA